MKKFFKKLIVSVFVVLFILFAMSLSQHLIYDAPPLSLEEYILSGIPKNVAITPRSGQIPTSSPKLIP